VIRRYLIEYVTNPVVLTGFGLGLWIWGLVLLGMGR
jgi:hypothetical protein